ncbi:acetyltransferase [Anaerosalibacter massiliensis]|uniref:acetyltransferase n=1 Tax=Anaerosalibacter massiliensis TaxID=1347392 RepID=UPI0009465741|nr:acetyltransferase [Anaerosalibacter massiliensis]
MKENVILIGSGQHARVILYNIEEQGLYNVVGILDSDKSKEGFTFEGLPILGSYLDIDLKDVERKFNTNKFFMAFGNMKYRKEVYDYFINKGWESFNIIHPNAVVSSKAKLGKGILIEAGCLVTPNPVIGDNVIINTGSQVNHDNIIHDNVHIASGVVLSGSVTINEKALIDDGVIVSLGRKIGRESIIGAGSVVTKDIPNNVIAYGNPCKVIRKNNKF